MSFRDVSSAESLYILPDPKLTTEAIVPYLSDAVWCDCMFGFFCSSALRELAPGLAEFVARPRSKMRLTMSPFLLAEDRAAIEAGEREPKDRILEALLREYGSTRIDAPALTLHTLSRWSVSPQSVVAPRRARSRRDSRFLQSHGFRAR